MPSRSALARGCAAVLLLLPASLPAQPLSPAPLAFDPADPAEQLARYLRVLAASPRDVPALIGAGRAALAVGDANAALSFFARADDVSPRNGPVKAGLAAALVQMEQPREALKLFDEAASLGVPEASIASDRGLARDLSGDGRRAQADYALALRSRDDPETVRRYALSLAIGGDRAGALGVLDPLLRRQDKGAWRVRAFVLALTGDQSGAERAAEATMPRPQALAMATFFGRLPGLRPGEKAAAVNFGHFPTSGRRYSEAELFADASPNGGARPPSVALPAPALRADSALIPSGAPLGPRERDAAGGAVFAGAPLPDPLARAPRRRPGTSDAAPGFSAELLPTPAPPNLAAPRLAAPVARPASAPARAAAAPRLPRTTLALDILPTDQTPRAPLGTTTVPPPAASPPARNPAPTGPSATAVASAAPSPSPPTTTAATLPSPSPAAAAPASASVAPPAAAPIASPPAVAQASSPAPSFATREPNRIATVDIPASTPVSAASSPVAPTVATATPPSPAPVSVGGAAELAAAPVARGLIGPPASFAEPPPSDAATLPPRPAAPIRLAQAEPPPETPAETIVHTAPTGAAATTKAHVSKPSPPVEKPKATASEAAKIRPEAKAKPGEDRDAAEAKPAAKSRAKPKAAAEDAETKPAAKGRSKAKVEDVEEADTKPLTRAEKARAAAKAKAEAKAKADAEAKRRQDEADKAEARAEAKAKKSDPERYWVQVASGANRKDLGRAWGAAKEKSKLLAGRTAWTAPWRASNRVLVGPFKSDDEAQAFVNKLGKTGVSGIQFTSRAGAKVEKLGGE